MGIGYQYQSFTWAEHISHELYECPRTTSGFSFAPLNRLLPSYQGASLPSLPSRVLTLGVRFIL